MEQPILETAPPFVIKIYETYFHISGDADSDKEEDKYPYEKIKSIEIVKENLQPTVSEGIGTFLLGLLLNKNMPSGDEIVDELLIEFKSGKTERRYFNGVSSHQYVDAIELLKTKIAEYSK